MSFRVSIHAPAGGATRTTSSLRFRCACFNPRARGGRDPVRQLCDSIVWVSIHAPAGGATSQAIIQALRRIVSIHAPAGGATICRRVFLAHIAVSIHAPAGGATPRQNIYIWRKICFNPRARGGRDFHCAIKNQKMANVSIHAPAGGAT